MTAGPAADDVMARLAATPRLVREAVAGIPGVGEPGVEAAPGPADTAADRWSVADVVVHLAAVDAEVWTPRLRQLATEAHPAWAWTEPDMTGRAAPTVPEAVSAFEAARAALLEQATGLDAEARARTGIHAVFGELDAAGLLREALAHDAEHLADLRARSGDAHRA